MCHKPAEVFSGDYIRLEIERAEIVEHIDVGVKVILDGDDSGFGRLIEYVAGDMVLAGLDDHVPGDGQHEPKAEERQHKYVLLCFV